MKRLAGLLLIICILALSGCGGSRDANPVQEGAVSSMINIYYPEGNEVVQADEQYQIKQPDSLYASVEEVMAVLAQKLDSSLAYHTYMLDNDNNVSLEFVAEGDVDKEYCLLASAAVSHTLFQIEDIGEVDIRLLDEEGSILSENTYLPESFYFYDYDLEDVNRRYVTIYYGNKAGNALTTSQVKVNEEPDVTVEESIVLSLASRGAIPKETEVISVEVNAGVCYLNLNKDFSEAKVSTRGNIVLYSVVNSLSELPEIDLVQIYIEGAKVKSFRGVSDTDVPLCFNQDILE